MLSPNRRYSTGHPDLWMCLYIAVLIYWLIIFVSMSLAAVELRKHQWRSYMKKASRQQIIKAPLFCARLGTTLFVIFFLLINLSIFKLVPTKMMTGIALQ